MTGTTRWRMPPEWAPHERTWMAWPSAGYTLGDTEDDADTARATWASVARAVAGFEPVALVADPGSADLARAWTRRGGPTLHAVEVTEARLDDAWMRDTGPTFVLDDDDRLGAVDWVFNGWGAQEWATWDDDDLVAAEVADRAGAVHLRSDLVNEGGGLHVDGLGTVLLTETVQLDPGRNPTLSRADVEAELARTVAGTTFVWLPRGLTRDYDEFGTRGHVDIVATFAEPGTVLLHWQGDPAHPDHAVCLELEGLLSSTPDARGFPPTVVRVPAPRTLEDGHGWVDWSYINHLVVNGGVVACAFDDAQDAESLALLERAYPARTVVGVDARPLFDRGGGIHCITQQQPRARPAPHPR